MSDKAAILWVSNSTTSPSGYGQQTKEFLTRIKNTGRNVALHAFYGCEGAPFMSADGILVLPRVMDAFGNDVVFGHYQYSQSQMVISLIDPHALNPEVYKQFPWCAWTPIDSTPLLPANKEVLKVARWIWAMSRHGERMLRDAGYTNNVFYVPHGIDTKVFDQKDRNLARAEFSKNLSVNIEGKFLVMANSANKGAPSRKGFYELLSAFKAFSDVHSDAMLYLHTEVAGAFQGENLPNIMKMIDLGPDKVIFPPQYQLVCGMLSPEYLAYAYNAADVFLSTSHGEGFGIPIIEAQSCGAPVIVTNSSAMTELCLTGLTIPSVTYMPVVGTTWQRPDIAATVTALEHAYTHWRNNEAIRTEARQKSLIYDADAVFTTYMLPALEAMERDLFDPTPPQKILKKRHYTDWAIPSTISEVAYA